MDSDTISEFARGLREVRRSAGNPSYRSLERIAHYSRTTLSQAAAGRAFPSLPVTVAFVAACGGDVAEWERRWRSAMSSPAGQSVDSPWPAQAVVDGAGPEEAGCSPGAVTVHARKISLSGKRHIIGQVELRYNPQMHAVWGRFEGFSGLDHTAHRYRMVEVVVSVGRDDDGTRLSYRDEYCFDYHWSALLCTGNGLFFAHASVFFDGELVAEGRTDAFPLR